jgi:hypothetical protein
VPKGALCFFFDWFGWSRLTTRKAWAKFVLLKLLNSKGLINQRILKKTAILGDLVTCSMKTYYWNDLFIRRLPVGFRKSQGKDTLFNETVRN